MELDGRWRPLIDRIRRIASAPAIGCGFRRGPGRRQVPHPATSAAGWRACDCCDCCWPGAAVWAAFACSSAAATLATWTAAIPTAAARPANGQSAWRSWHSSAEAVGTPLTRWPNLRPEAFLITIQLFKLVVTRRRYWISWNWRPSSFLDG